MIFGATDYTCQIDVWSAGCVLAELLLGQPIFPGDSGVDQLVEIIKILGTPTREQIREMNPNYTGQLLIYYTVRLNALSSTNFMNKF